MQTEYSDQIFGEFDAITKAQEDVEQMMQDGEKIHQTNAIISHHITKNDIPSLAEMLIHNVLESGDPLRVAENIKIMELLIDTVKSDKRFKDYALDELAKHGKKFTSPRGVIIEPFEASGRYDFSKCDDFQLEVLYNQQEELNQKIKDRERFLKALPAKGLIVTDEQTGETMTIYPPAKPPNTGTYKITIPK